MRDRSTSVNPHPVETVPPAGTNVLFDVWLLSKATTGLLDAALVSSGLSADEFGIYSVLTSAEAMTPTDLTRWMGVPPTTISSVVKRLERRGHVVREPNPDDGRSSLLHLTPAGRDAHRRAATAFAPVLESVVVALGRDEASVRASLALLRDVVRSRDTA